MAAGRFVAAGKIRGSAPGQPDAHWAADGPLPTHVLLVEDTVGDVRLTLEAFREVDSSIRLHVAADGIEAMAFLGRQGVHAYEPRPDLILLDLNMPKMDGREVLAMIKNDYNLRTIPVVILSSSELNADVAASYNLHAQCYLRKPMQYDAFCDLIRGIHQFWLTGGWFPQQTDPGATTSSGPGITRATPNAT
jgi:CheY-like chemotaxis protein